MEPRASANASDTRPGDRSAAFTVDDNWHGGFYELAIELGDTDDQRLEQALTAVWDAAGVRGCFGERSAEPADQATLACTLASLESPGTSGAW